jgi:hypothetical protein
MEEHEKIKKRRESEDFLYERIEKNIILKRLPLKKQKKHKEYVRVSKIEYTFLQYGFLIRKWALRNHKLTETQLDMLLYICPLAFFSRQQFLDAQKEAGKTSGTMFSSLLKAGWLLKWSESKRKVYYTLSHKGNLLVSRMHSMYMLEEKIPVSVKNAVARSKDRKDKKLMDLFKTFNDKVNKSQGNP